MNSFSFFFLINVSSIIATHFPLPSLFFFFFNDTATTEIYTLSLHDALPIYGRMYQTPFADRIRNEVGIATMAVGAIFEPDHVNSIIASGRADLCALARP